MSESDSYEGTTVIKMADHKNTALYRWPSNEDHFLPKPSDWKCYMFGHTPNGFGGLVYTPTEGNVPNWFVRWMMKVCLGCTWVKIK